MEREAMLAAIDAAYDARRRGDMAALASLLAPGAEFELAGEEGLLHALVGSGRCGVEDAARVMHELIRIDSLDMVSATVESNRAAVLWNAKVRFDHRPPLQTRLFDLWEFDAEGRISKLLQFADTARIGVEMAAMSMGRLED